MATQKPCRIYLVGDLFTDSQLVDDLTKAGHNVFHLKLSPDVIMAGPQCFKITQETKKFLGVAVKLVQATLPKPIKTKVKKKGKKKGGAL